MERRLPDWIEGYLKYTVNTEPRDSYRTWVAISTIASAIKRNCWLHWGSETWYVNFYIILTGPPAARKGTAMQPARDFLDRMGVKMAASEPTRQVLINKLEGALTTDTDITGKIYFHSSMTINAPELTVFLKAKDADMLAMLCDWFDCRAFWDYETITRERQEVTNVWVNLLGATTPALLQASLSADAFGGGLISRSLFIYESNKGKIIIYPTLNKAIGEDLLIDLESIATLRGGFRIPGNEVIDIYADWRNEMEANPPFTDQRLLKCNERLPMYIWKISMVCSLSRSNDLVITSADFVRAKELLEKLVKKMPIAFAGIGANPLAAVQHHVMLYIAKKGTVTVKELNAAFYQDVNPQQMAEILGTLATIGFLTLDTHTRLIHFKGDNYEAEVAPLPIKRRN